MRRPRLRSVLIAVGLVGPPLAASGAGAGEAPPSAVSTAQQVPPQLLDTDPLAFEHPQRSVLGPTSITSYGTSDAFSSNSSLAATWVLGSRLAVSGLSQRESRSYAAAIPLTSGQLAARIGPVRLGGAYRRGKSKDSREYEQVYPDFPVTRRVREYSRESDELREFAFGAGISAGGASVDFTAMLVDVEREGVGRRERTGEAPFDAAVAIDAGDRWGGTLRAQIPFPFGTGVTLAASFQDLRSRMTYRQLDQYLVEVSGAQDLYGHEWSAALGVSRPLPTVGRVRLHGAYRDVRDPGRSSASYEVRVAAQREDRLQGGVSLERPGWWETTLFAGAAVYRTRSWNESLRTNRDSWSRDADHSEDIDHGFAWGASRTIGDFDLAARVSRTLSISNPLAELDVRMRF